jgi:hypothetical protein
MANRKDRIDTATDYAKVVQLAATGLGLITGAAGLIEARRQRLEARDNSRQQSSDKAVVDLKSKVNES